MATNKNALIRYKVLDNCFRNPGKRYFINDLIEECESVLLEIDPESKMVSRAKIDLAAGETFEREVSGFEKYDDIILPKMVSHEGFCSTTRAIKICTGILHKDCDRKFPN